MDAQSTLGVAIANVAGVGHTAVLRGKSTPYVFKMNLGQSCRSLAEIDVCSRIISWKSDLRSICLATARASSGMLCHAQENLSGEGD
jgi:hypothetical protein